MIIINPLFAPQSIYMQRITMDLIQFQGGVASYLVSNDQVVSEISDAIGLGAELYFNKKKVDMLQDPSAYLVERNKALLAEGANTENVYATILDSVVKSVTGKPDIKKDNPEYQAIAKQAWVKSLACDMAVKLASIQVTDINIKYPILDSAYKAQKSKNSRVRSQKRVYQGRESVIIFPINFSTHLCIGHNNAYIQRR